MASLMDTIQQNSNILGSQQQANTDQTQQTAQLMRAKSGKAVSGPSVGPSSLGEQQAVANTNNTMQNQVAPQAAMQGQQEQQQSSAIQQQTQNQLAGVAQQRAQNTAQTNTQVNSTLSDLERQKGQVDQQRQAAALNQVGTAMRLQTQQYTDQLQREGNMARLNDQNQFQQALTKSIFGANQDLLESKLNNQSILDATNNEYSQVLSQMGVNDSWNIFQTEQQAAQTRAGYTTAAGVATTGAGVYGNLANRNFGSSAPTDNNPAGSESAGINSNTFEE